MNYSENINPHSNMDHMCRFCLKENLTMEKIIFTEIKPLYKIVTQIQLELCTDYSQYMCQDCSISIRNCAQQIKDFQRVDQFWKNLFSTNNDFKLEIDENADIKDDGKIVVNFTIPNNDSPSIHAPQFEIVDFQYKPAIEFVTEIESNCVKVSNPLRKKPQHKCSRCQEIFDSTKEYREHKRNVHFNLNPTNTFICDICGSVFMNRTKIEKHVKKHFPQEFGEYKCLQCDRIFKLRRYYDAHLKDHYKEWKCKICDKQFLSGYAMRAHIKNHIDKPITCEECGKIYKNKIAFYTHKRFHHNKNPIHCELCNKPFNSSNSLKDHMLKHSDERKYVCDICGMKCKSHSSIKRHIRVVHKENKIDRRIKNGTNVAKYKLQCPICSKQYSFAPILRKHLETKHTPTWMIIWENLKTVVCLKCNKEFPCPSALTDHRHLVHQVQCDICKVYVNSKESLQKHIQMHKGDRPFKCKECSASYSRSTHLSGHIRRFHTNDRPFKCVLCEKTFVENYELTSHTKFAHSDIKPYECNICGSAFKNCSSLQSHVLTHSGNFNYSCEICSTKYRTGQSLEKHKISKHSNTLIK